MYFDSKDKSSTYFLSLVTPLSGLDTAQVQTPAPEDRMRPVSVTLNLSWEDRGWRLEAETPGPVVRRDWGPPADTRPLPSLQQLRPHRHGMAPPAPASSLNVTEYVNTWTSYDKLAIYRPMNWLYVCLKVTFKSVFGSTICASSVNATEYEDMLYVNTELHHVCHAANHKTQHNYLGILLLPRTSVQIILLWKDRLDQFRIQLNRNVKIKEMQKAN